MEVPGQRPIRVLWFVEHLARELDVACAVKCLAESRHPVEITIRHLYLHAAEVLAGPAPDIVVHPFFYFADGALGQHHYVRAWPRALHFNLAWEELFYAANARIKGPSDDFARLHVLHHAWGDFYRKFLIAHGVPAAHIHVNGNPAYQLYKAPYSRIAPDRELLARSLGEDPARSWVFIPENYRWAFFTEHKLQKLAASEDHLAQLIEMKEHCVRSLEILVGWCQRRAAAGDAAIILRPRPATNTRILREFVERVVGQPAPLFHITKEGSVREWILGSDVVLSSFSTSLVEAAIAARPIYMIEPLPLPPGLHADWYAHVERVRTEDDFHRVIAAGARAESWRRLGEWAHGELLSNGDPIEGLASVIGRLAAPDQDLAPRPPRRGLFRAWRERSSSRRARQEGAQAIRMNRDTHEGDDLTAEDVQRRTARWREILLEEVRSPPAPRRP